jgi:hypothetical protein
MIDRKAGFPQSLRDEFCDRPIVFDDQRTHARMIERL